MTGPFAKYEALGNDYLVIDPTRTALPITRATVALLCDRHFGVGGDGVLYGPFFERDAVRLRIFNSDGSECEKSGNGLRMFARYLRDHGHVTTDAFVLRTLAGDAAVQVVDLAMGVFTISMGTFTFDSERIPAVGPARRLIDERLDLEGESLRINCVNVGNPRSTTRSSSRCRSSTTCSASDPPICSCPRPGAAVSASSRGCRCRRGC